jgi:uncharacterized repeat protein (TIGR01451 family)
MTKKKRDGPGNHETSSLTATTSTKEKTMKTQTASPSRLYQRTVVGLSLLALTLTAILGSATPASALLAGGAKIINIANVGWTGGPVGGVDSTPVIVTVNNVTAPPVVGTDPADATITTKDTNTTEHVLNLLTYYITNKGTGLETITLSGNGPNYSPSGIGNPDASLAVAASIALGGTVANANVGAGITITVPSDGTTDSSVNGITAGDFVVIGTTIYQVAAGGVVDNATTNVATITLTAAHAGVLAGTQIGERGSVTLSITTGTLPTAAEGTYAATVTATSGVDSASGTNTVHVRRPSLTITKEVSTDGGLNFGGNANAAAGTLLTYRITVTNTGSANATVVTITDPIPAYTSYVGNAKFRLTTDALPAADNYSTASPLTNGLDGDGYTGDATAATYDIASLDAVGGNDVVILYFQVTIDNP